MGNTISTLFKALRTIRLAIVELNRSNASFQTILRRIEAGPGLPQPTSTASFWWKDPPFPELMDMQSAELPASTDVVVIGSGISAAAVARTILLQARRTNKKVHVLVLEARQLCSGATGRNGGHIKSAPYKAFAVAKKAYGLEKAVQLVRFQRMHLDCLVDMCTAEKFDLAECRRVETVDLIADEDEFQLAKTEVEDVRKHLPELEIRVWEAGEAREACIGNSTLNPQSAPLTGCIALWSRQARCRCRFLRGRGHLAVSPRDQHLAPIDH
jgi:hypothetical protein